jgi:hypothetical protein
VTSKTVNSRDGVWAYEVLGCGRVVSVTHKPSGEILQVRSSLTSLRQRAASGDLLRTIERMAYQRDHKMAMHLADNLGREIQVDGVWHRIARCNGYGPDGLVNVWVAGQNEPLQLPAADYFPVRDPEPAPFTVIGARYDSTGAFVSVAAVAGVVPAVGNGGVMRLRPEAHTVTAHTADKAIAKVFGTTAEPVGDAEASADRWTVVGLFDRHGRSYTSLVALAGEHEILGGYDSMFESRQVTVVDAPDAVEAIDRVARQWDSIDDEGDDW